MLSFTFNQWKLKLDATLYLSNVKLLGNSICLCRNTKFSYYERIIVNWYDFFQKGIWQQISDRGLKWISYDQRNPIKRIYPKDIKKKKYKRAVYRDYHHSIIKLAKTTYKTKKHPLKF